LSGGIDSTTAMALALSHGQDVETLFVEYGQAAAAAEARASTRLAAHFGCRSHLLRLQGLAFGSGFSR
jgi:7-cyano-7-deazaguanine synthase